MITDYHVLELVIGADSNRRSLIREGIDGPLLAEQSTGSILQCSFYQWFWIDWSRGVSMGNGYEVGDSVFLSLESMPVGFSVVNYFTIATGPGIDGDWDFSSVPGCLEISTSIKFIVPSFHIHFMDHYCCTSVKSGHSIAELR
jgi:Farnesoic acid 0-methyl transferase